MGDFDLAVALVGGLIPSLGAISDFVKQYVSFVTEPLVAVAYGALVGPAGLGLPCVAAFGDRIVLFTGHGQVLSVRADR